MGRAIDPSVGNHVFAVPIKVWGDYLADASTNQFFAVPIKDTHWYLDFIQINICL